MTAARPRTVILALVLGAMNATRSAADDDPRIEPGHDPGGIAIAILADGFDYTKPDLAAVLARDGEGEAIAWDTIGENGHPFHAESQGTDTARAATAHGGVRIVMVRVDRTNAASLARGIAFAAQTPAKIVFAAHPLEKPAARDVLAAAARKFEQLLFVAPHPGKTDSVGTEKADEIANLILIENSADGLAPAHAVARVLGCGSGMPVGEMTGAEHKRAFLERFEAAATACEPERKPGSEQK